ncbi:MAG: hypothetical protein U0Q20_08815 [Mycobacterium sp.]|nr:hypothetical protein [Mycobacterium sp.]
MTAGQGQFPDEPEAPARGLTSEERGRDVSAPQAEAEAKKSTWARMVASMSPRFVWSMAEGYPPGIKQFLQFCLILIYPAWVAGVALSALVYGAVYSVLWVLFWPVRAWMKRNRPEDYAASQQK